MRNKYTEKDYIDKCIELDLEYVGTHKENKKGTMVDFVCEKHSDRGVQSVDWSHFRTYKIGCTYCSGRHRTVKSVQEIFDKKNIELISEYSKTEEGIVCRCKVCGYIWDTRFHYVTREGRGCPSCGLERRRQAKLRTTEQFISDLKSVNENISVVGEYIGAHKKVLCRCNVCGEEWDAYPSNLLNRSAGCPRCHLSIGERELLDTLEALAIPYTPQFHINDGNGKMPLRFDAYSEEYMTAFEYNGEQHYFPVDFAHRGIQWANDEFESTKARDCRKVKYCEENGIKMVIIPYWDRDNMKKIIEESLNEGSKKLVS